MKLSRSKKLGLVAMGALALGVSIVGCSTDAGAPGGFGDDSGPPGADASGQSDGSSAASSSSGSGGSGSSGRSGSNSSGGSGGSASNSSGSSSGSGSSGGSGSNSGSGSSSGSGGADGGGGRDASVTTDASANRDAGVAGSDAGLCADQAVWLTPMNQARNMVNAGEPPLVCDPIAAQVALNYAQQCNYAHNPNAGADYAKLGGTGGLGENIAAGSPTYTPAQAVAAWVSEIQYYTHATNTCATGQVCGHYTQIVWKATTGVGCAHVSCTTPNPQLGGATMWDYSVCDFSPPGNVVTQSPY